MQVDYENSSTKFLGWVVASYSFGQLVASPFFGTWADHRPTREPLIVATTINIVFNVVYSYLGAFESGVAGWMMIMSRSLVGFGAGVIGREGGWEDGEGRRGVGKESEREKEEDGLVGERKGGRRKERREKRKGSMAI